MESNCNDKPMIYLGHPIRGKMTSYGKEDAGIYQYENVNCAQAIANVHWLRKEFPQVRWYCPGEVEIPIQTAHRMGFLTVPQILEVDFHIIKELCSGAVLHKWEPSKGLAAEQGRCEAWNYPHVVLEGPWEIENCDLVAIKKVVDQVLAVWEALSLVNKDLKDKHDE
jgi:hypothetical protein